MCVHSLLMVVAADHHPQVLDRGSHCKVPSAEALYCSGRIARKKVYSLIHLLQCGGQDTYMRILPSEHLFFLDMENTILCISLLFNMDVVLLTGTMCAGSGELCGGVDMLFTIWLINRSAATTATLWFNSL